MTGKKNSKVGLLDLTCLNVFNGCDECTLTNWAITRTILRTVNLSCITSASVLPIVKSVDGLQ